MGLSSSSEMVYQGYGPNRIVALSSLIARLKAAGADPAQYAPKSPDMLMCVPTLYPASTLYTKISETSEEICLHQNARVDLRKHSKHVCFEGWEMYIHFTVVYVNTKVVYWTAMSKDLSESSEEARYGYGRDEQSAAYDLFFRGLEKKSPLWTLPSYVSRLVACLGPEDDISEGLRPVYSVKIDNRGTRVYYVVHFENFELPCKELQGAISTYWIAKLEKMSVY